MPLAIVDSGGYCICECGVKYKHVSRTAGCWLLLGTMLLPTSIRPLLLLPSCVPFSSNTDTFRSVPLNQVVRVQSYTRQEHV